VENKYPGATKWLEERLKAAEGTEGTKECVVANREVVVELMTKVQARLRALPKYYRGLGRQLRDPNVRTSPDGPVWYAALEMTDMADDNKWLAHIIFLPTGACELSYGQFRRDRPVPLTNKDQAAQGIALILGTIYQTLAIQAQVDNGDFSAHSYSLDDCLE
jgi:hypothetical protein